MPCPGHTLGGWEVVVRALSRSSPDQDMRYDALMFLINYAKLPTDKEVIKATLDVLAKTQVGASLLALGPIITGLLSTQKGSLPLIRDSGVVELFAGSLDRHKVCAVKESVLNLIETVTVPDGEEIKVQFRIVICRHLQAFVERNECHAYASSRGDLKAFAETIGRNLLCDE